jgi:hypothetical protein
MPLVEFGPVIPRSERLQTDALDRAATEIGYGASLGPNSKHQKMYKYTISKFFKRETSLFHIGVAEAFALVRRVTSQKSEGSLL